MGESLNGFVNFEGTEKLIGTSGQLIPSSERITNTLLMNVAVGTRRIYYTDAKQFLLWLEGQGESIETIGYDGISEYRANLYTKYQKGTAARKLVVSRRLLDIAVILNVRPDNPAQQVKGFKGAGDDETTHRALTKFEAQNLFACINTTTLKGKRDYALLMLLLRTGLRRAEAANLIIGDITSEQGHTILIIRRGKGNKRRVVKLPVDVYRFINNYLEAANRQKEKLTSPLFVRFGKGNRLKDEALDGRDIERIVTAYAHSAGLDGLTPHGLRATFVTLTLEAGAKLHQVQYAVGHSDPRTTERYQKRKTNLDDNPVDYIKF